MFSYRKGTMKYILMIGGAVLLVLAVVIAFSFSVISDQNGPLNGTLLEPAEAIEPLNLLSGDGPVSTEAYYGKFVVIVFGYTYCPDVCPATLARVAQALRLLDDKSSRVQVLMVSVDPERDTPERMTAYASRFGDQVTGLTGSPEQIAAAASQFGIFYEKAAVDSTENYLVDHTTSSMVLDRRGNLVMVWSFDLTAEEMASDMAFLIDHR